MSRAPEGGPPTSGRPRGGGMLPMGGGLVRWAFLGLALAGVGWLYLRSTADRPVPPPATSPDPPTEPVSSHPLAGFPSTGGTTVEPSGTSPEAPMGATGSRPRGSTGETGRDDSIRTPPPGTSPEAAHAFARLPVGRDDRPPVGGVGATGIHVDRISLGARYGRSGCGGKQTRFSITDDHRVNVCFRVVHPREQDEELLVVWDKRDGSRRRAPLGVPSEYHGYRTRAYLVLRKEYAGQWDVQILSGDTVLASRSFTVVK